MITVLSHGRLLDCAGNEPEEDISVVVEEGKIKDIYSGKKKMPAGVTIVDVSGMTILPGLTDAYGHSTFTDHGAQRYNNPPIVTAVKIIRNLELDLEAGFTTLADHGGGNWALKYAIEEGLIKGPRFLISCSSISKTSGHGDFSNFREGLGELTIRDTSLLAIPRIADGINEVRKVTREQLRNGADFIKIYATGGASTPNDKVMDVGFSEGELRAFVEEAEDNGKYVTAHCSNNKGIKRAIKCGVKSIQHGVGFDKEAALMLKEKGFYHIPTLLIFKMVAEKGHETGASVHFIRRAAEVVNEAMRSAELTHRLKCNVGFGTCCSPYIGHGKQGVEFKLRTECGMKPYDVIKAATVVNARLFGMQDKIGTIEIGKWADIIAVDGKPDENIELLIGTEHIKLVMKNGEIMKNTL